MKNLKNYITLLLIGLLSLNSFAQENAQTQTLTKPGSKAAKIKATIAKFCNEHTFSGAVLVAQNNQLVWKESRGLANHETGEKNATNTKFLVGSVSKQFTSMIVLQLVQEGKIKLTDRAIKYLPFLPKEKAEITIHQLLSHSSGLGHYSSLKPNFSTFSRKALTPVEYAKIIANMNMIAKPGEKMSYSSMGYILLAVIAEKVTGKTFGKLIEKRIAKPLGLKNTGFTLHTDKLTNFAASYDVVNHKIPEKDFKFTKNNPRHQSNTYSTGGVHSTVEDLFVWTKALQTNQLLNKKYRHLMFTPQKGDYGYGWFINDSRLKKRFMPDLRQSISHGGAVNSYLAVVIMFDNNKDAVFILVNSPSRIWRLTAKIKKVLDEK